MAKISVRVVDTDGKETVTSVDLNEVEFVGHVNPDEYWNLGVRAELRIGGKSLKIYEDMDSLWEEIARSEATAGIKAHIAEMMGDAKRREAKNPTFPKLKHH